MPSLIEDESPVLSPLSKKRRRDDTSHHHSVTHDPRATFQPSYASLDLHHDASLAHNSIDCTFRDDTSQSSPLSRKVLPMTAAAKRHRTLSAADVKDRSARTGSPVTRPAPAPMPMSASQYKRNHCHICGRRPMVRADMDAYADCEGCGNRTCFVCIRQCLGWIDETPGKQWGQGDKSSAPAKDTRDMNNGLVGTDMQQKADELKSERSHSHQDRTMDDATQRETSELAHNVRQDHDSAWAGAHREMVCSRCCVEKGSDGDVVCLGCLPYV